MKKIITAALLLLSFSAAAQCDVLLLHDDYSDPSPWTPVVTTPGAVTVSGGTMNYNNVIGGSYGRMYRPLPATLPDTYWNATCTFRPASGNAVSHYVMAFTADTLDPISYDGAFPLTNEDAIMVYYVDPNPPSTSTCCQNPSTGPWQLQARSKKGLTLAAPSTGIPLTALNQDTYVQLIRQSPGLVILRAFSDSALTTELPGSPVYYCIDPTITGLKMLHQGVITWSSALRRITAKIDDLRICLGSIASADTTHVQACGSATLQAPFTAASYTWMPATTGCNSCAQATVSVPAAGSTSYYSVAVGTGCSAITHYFAVQQDTACPPPGVCPVTAGPDTSICPGATVQLHATAGFDSYHWSPGTGLSDSTIADPLATVIDNIQYVVTATNSSSGTGPNLLTNGDFSMGNTGFTSALTPTSLYSPGDYYVGPTFFTTAYATSGDHTPTADGMFMSVDGAPTLETLWQETVTGLTPGSNYTFSFWATLGSVNVAQFQIHMIGNVSGDAILATLAQPPGAPPPASYWIWGQLTAPVWNSGANTSVTIRIINTELNGYGNDFGLDDFYFTLPTSGTCSGTDTMSLSVNPKPAPPATHDTSYCAGASTLALQAAGSNLVWYASPGSAGDTLAPTPSSATAGTFTYYVTQTVNGCLSDTAALRVSVLDPAPVFALNKAQPPCSQKTMTLGPQNPAWNYVWENGDTLSPRTVTGSGTYVLTASNSCGSTSDTTRLVFEDCHCYFYAPNAFTPNDNGTDDTYLPKHDCIFGTYKMMIFDRWGEKIFESTDPAKGWDGTYHGAPAELGVYVARFSYTALDESGYMNPKTLITAVTLIR